MTNQEAFFNGAVWAAMMQEAVVGSYKRPDGSIGYTERGRAAKVKAGELLATLAQSSREG